nr:hypothetical protein CFP56_65521 [Quercus suber]
MTSIWFRRLRQRWTFDVGFQQLFGREKSHRSLWLDQRKAESSADCNTDRYRTLDVKTPVKSSPPRLVVTFNTT